MLSPNETNLLVQIINQETATFLVGKTKKLRQTLHDKSNYTLPYKLLQLYVRLGLKFKKRSVCWSLNKKYGWNHLSFWIRLNANKLETKFWEGFVQTFKHLCLWENMRVKAQVDARSHT